MRTLSQVCTKLLDDWDYIDDDYNIRRDIATQIYCIDATYNNCSYSEQDGIFERKLIRAISDYKYMIKRSNDEQYKASASKKLDIYIKIWKYFHGVE